MFGGIYQKEMYLEIFLRYLDDGIQYIKEVREKLYFIPDVKFIYVLKTAYERGLILINYENKTIFMPRNIKRVIDFIEKFNPIENIEKKLLDDDYIIEGELSTILKEVNFFESRYNMQSKLINCINYYYKEKNKENNIIEEDYSHAVIKLRLDIKYKKDDKDNNERVGNSKYD